MKKNGKKLGSDLEFAAKYEIAPQEYDELPELTDEMLSRAVHKRNGKHVGRPVAENPKIPVSIRVSPEVESAYRASGKGWQTLMNKALMEWAIDHGML
jgi:uncharacterized protein (DUF4415 family)